MKYTITPEERVALDLKRENNAKIAELVFEHKVHRNQRGGWSLGPADYYDDHGSTELVNHLPDYFGDIAEAWQVVEKLRSLDFSVDVSSYPESREWLSPPYRGAPVVEWDLKKGISYYQCGVSKYDKYSGGWISVCDPTGNSAPEVICLAALQALGKEVGHG